LNIDNFVRGNNDSMAAAGISKPCYQLFKRHYQIKAHSATTPG